MRNIIKLTLSFLALIAAPLCSNAQSGTWKFVATGDASTYAIDSDGSLWAWGWNESGQLGIGGGDHKISVPQRVGDDSDWVFAAAGQAYAFFIKADGTLWAVGDNSKGVQGVGDGMAHKTLTQVGTDTDWKYVTASRFFGHSAFGIKTDGTLWAWGEGETGALGLGNYKNYAVPTQVGTDSDWKDVSSGNDFTLAVKEDGTLWGWGWNQNSNLSDLPTFVKTPAQIGNENDWDKVFAVSGSSYGIKKDGSLWVWGFSDNNTFGFDASEMQEITTPMKVFTITEKVVFISGYDGGRTVGTGENGVATKVYTWGTNADGALGNGMGVSADAGAGIENFPVPAVIDLPEGIKINQIASGEGYTVVRSTDGKLYGWGKNRGGQLGNYCPEDQMTFVQTYIKVGEKTEQDVDVLTFDAENIPASLAGVKKLKLIGAWGTSDFQQLTQTIGNNSGFPPAGNTVIESIDMSEATIKPNTSLYVPVGFSNAGTFQGCRALKEFVMPSQEEQANFVNLRSAFQNCVALEELDLTGCSNVTNMTDMMFGCKTIKKIDISSSALVTASESTFDQCTALEEVIMPASFVLSKFTFGYCESLKKIDWSRCSDTTAPDWPTDLFQDLSDETLAQITLVVPDASYESFANHNDWKKLNVVSASATDLNAIDADLRNDGMIYTVKGNAAGRDMNALPKGVYIVNGKKVLVK
jgi:alpha-tubulin suppressor-like RCC1 family protein